MILAGWAYTNDVEKMRRWAETVAWANNNGCADLVEAPGDDFYYADEPRNYAVGPLGGPMYRPWDFEAKHRPAANQIAECLKTLVSHWQEIVAPQLACVSRPLRFTGAKARRLLVWADNNARAPWGGWSYRSAVQSERRTFTCFRASINKAIAPHHVDHIDFITDGLAEKDMERNSQAFAE